MADIRLAKPAAGTTQTVPSAPDGRFIFDFPADAATLTRSGDNLVLTFEDGASIQLQDFYTTYSKEEMPSFQVEGVEISGQDFFAALGEDLMPAAGPAAGSSASRSGRYNEYGGSDLLDGLDHLGRLDIGFDGGVQLATDTVEPSPYYEDDHGVTVTPSAPGTDPDDPDIPVQGEDFPPTMPHDVLQVDESALDGGSGGGSATADGSMSVSAPDGVATITIGGVVVWQNGALTGNPVQTDEGHLDVTGFDGTNLTYTYTLDKATQEHGKEGGGENDAIAHEMEVVVTDSDGDSGSAVIRVEITDDVPVAYDNVNSVTENASASGNVLTDVDSAGKTDSFGADGGSGVTWDLSGYTNQEGGTDGTYTVTDGVYTVYTQYGVATLNPDGSYMFTAKADAGLTSGESASVGFGYTIKDSDGDSAAANLTITINGDSNVPTIDIAKPDTGDANIMVDEGALDGGSKQHTEHGASGSGSFTVQLNGEDGVITVGGENGWKVTVTGDSADVTGSVVTVNGVAVTVTGATQGEDGWTVNYSYALSGDQQHGTPGTGDYHTDELTGSIAISVTDATGDTESGTLTVEVHDDGPVAYDDVNSLAEEAESVSGNVLENDKSGADGWRTDADGNITAVELKGSDGGTYGTLTLNADGSYTYTRNETGVPDGGAEDRFTYIAYDADGDAVEKTLTITIENTDPTAPGGDGHTLTVTLSDADAAGENTDTANQSVDLFDGPEAFTSAVFGSTENIVVSGGESFTWSQSEGKLIGTGSESGAVVTLEITGITPDGTVTVSATLADPAHHNDGSNSLNISGIVITATDAGGSTVSGTMNVVVTDDTATGQDDVNRLAEEAESVSGNVLENDESGADGWRMDGEGNVAAVELSSSADGMYGTLMLNADGSYTYTRNETGVPDGGASDKFTYIAYDADGDAVEKTLTITIENTDPTAPGGDGHTLTVTLSDADAAGENTDTANQSVDLFDGPEAFTSAVFGSTENIVVSGGESFTWSQSEGKLIGTGSESGAVVTLEITGITPDGTVTVSATLADPAHHNDGSNSLNISGIVITATDAGGSTVSGTMNVVVTDDTATGQDDVNRLAEEAESVSGNVLENDESGADGWRMDGEGNVAAVELSSSADGMYGTLMLNADGSYTYTRNETGVPDGGASDKFTYIAYDADGDAVEKTLTITIENTDPTAPGGDGHTLTVTLSDADAAGENTDTANQSVDLFDGPEAFTSAVFGSTENIVVSGGESFTWSQSEGKLIGTGSESGAVVTLEITGITPDGTVTVSATLADPAHHNDGSNSLNISGIVITATDAGGSTVSGTMNVVVTDDTATGQDDVNRLAEEAESVSGNVLENDESGADGWRMDGGNVAAVELSSSADGMYGTLMLNADGSYTYTRNGTGVPDGGASDTFTYIAYDADGDAVEKTLTITIENTDPTAPGGEGHTLTVTLSDADAAGENTDTVNQNVDLFDGPEAFTSAVFGSTENIVVSGGESFKWRVSADGKLIGTGAESGAVVTLEITGITPDGTVTVSATLADPAHHNDGSNSLDISGIVITATDAGGSTVSGTMNVVVTDDVVDVGVINNNASLTVDESYADSVAGPGLELESSAKADTTSLNVSDLFSVDAGADGEASREYALSISNEQTEQKVLMAASMT